MRKKQFIMLVMGLMLVPFLMSTASAKTLKIGSMGPLTGPYAADGNDIKNGVLCAIDVVNDEGGIPGFDKIELFPQDTACDPKQAVAAANKLINLEVTGVIGAYCSSSTIPASETLAEEDIVMITPASTHQDVTDRGLPYMFRMCGRDDDQAPAAVLFMTRGLNAKSVFIVDDKTTYSQGLADGVRRNAEKQGMMVLGHDHVNQGDKDFSAVLTKIKRASPDVFYMSLQNHASGSIMVIQARRMGLDVQILSQDAMFHPNFVKVAKKAAEGVYVTYGFTDKSTPAYQTYAKRFTANYGEIGAYGTYAYDAAIAYFKAVKMAGTTDPAKVKAALLKLKFQGASKKVKFNKKGDSGSSYVAFKITDGEYKLYWTPADAVIPLTQ
jgi:branched-chain amino acid transport system substrate-binding protein